MERGCNALRGGETDEEGKNVDRLLAKREAKKTDALDLAPVMETRFAPRKLPLLANGACNVSGRTIACGGVRSDRAEPRSLAAIDISCFAAARAQERCRRRRADVERFRRRRVWRVLLALLLLSRTMASLAWRRRSCGGWDPRSSLETLRAIPYLFRREFLRARAVGFLDVGRSATDAKPFRRSACDSSKTDLSLFFSSLCGKEGRDSFAIAKERGVESAPLVSSRESFFFLAPICSSSPICERTTPSLSRVQQLFRCE